MEPVRWAGGQEVPGVDVRKLVLVAWVPTTLMWVMIAKSRVLSTCHSVLKVGHSNSQNL
jgi:hypothetical protein